MSIFIGKEGMDVIRDTRCTGYVHKERANASSGIKFGAAIIKHFNLPIDKVSASIKMNTGSDDIFGVTITIMLTADDMLSIAQIMKLAEIHAA